MPPRRLPFLHGPALAVAATAAAILGGCLPWSLDLPGVSGFVRKGLAETYGLSLATSGKTGVSLLPLPRLSFADATLAADGPNGPVLARGGTLTLQLSLAALLGGRVEVVSVALDGADITLPRLDDPLWSATLKRLADVTDSTDVSHPRRVTLQRARVIGWDPRDGSRQEAEGLDATLSWPPWSAAMEFKGGFTWNAGNVQFALSGLRPADLLAGRDTPLAVTAEWKAGTLAVEGSGHLGESPAFTGRARLQNPALSETLAWIGTDLALSPLIEALTVDTTVDLDRDGLRLPSLQIWADDTVLVGAGSIEMAGRRPSIRATLDAQTLNLSPVLAGLFRTGGLEGLFGENWARRPLALKSLAGGDLDLRLSSNTARIGPFQIDDLAGGILVRADAIDATLRRASLHGGTLKGRVLLSAPAESAETELRATGAFEQLDLTTVQADLGGEGWITGPARGTFALIGSGSDLGTMLGRLTGRAMIAVDSGAIAGIDLVEALHHRDAPAPRLLARKDARTTFDRAQLSVAFRDGQGEIDEGALEGPSLSASLRGRISLLERSVAAEATLTQPAASAQPVTRSLAPAAPPVAVYEIAGPWSGVSVQAKTQRDGAASVIGRTLAVQPDMARSGLPSQVRAYAP